MGGDFAPSEIILGAQLAIEKYDNLEIVLFGEEDKMNQIVSLNKKKLPNLTFKNTGDSIQMSENPTRSVARKKDSSINQGIQSLNKGDTDVFISAGNTGAIMVSAMFHVGLLDGLQRPILSTLLPKLKGEQSILLDVGANADCKPEHLNQFALIGSRMMSSVFGISNPKVALLNIGEEKEKGNILYKETYRILSQNNNINFIGNLEGRMLFETEAHVVVCDGFTGNIILKTAEGLGQQFIDRGIKDNYLNKFDYRKQGGTPLLGLKKPVIIGHGISKRETVINMIKLGMDIVNSNLFKKIEQSL
jgi:glycerol-3-phosphate acyltransferase PlsX